MLTEEVLPDSQCWFWSERGCVDMVFCAQQLVEKAISLWTLEKRMILSPDKLTSLKSLQVYSFLSLVMPVLASKITGVRDSASLDLK